MATGACSTPAAPEGTACDDGNACTQTDTCSGGVCVGSNPVVCSAAPCHIAGTCDQATGACSNLLADDGTACGNAGQTCASGVCVAPTPATCGNGTVDPGEACDDGNRSSCGTCSADCSRVQLAAATGSITATPGASLFNGATFTVSDGVHPPVTFEFQQVNGVGSGHIRVPFSTGDSASIVAGSIASAINNTATSLAVSASQSGGTVNLTNDSDGSAGNQTISGNVTAAGFVLTGMFGGQGFDCAAGTGCSGDADCVPSLSCDPSTHTCRSHPQTLVFGFTGDAQVFTVPTGVSAVTITAYGASGGALFETGGFGGATTATVPVTPGEGLIVLVGGTSFDTTGGFNGGGPSGGPNGVGGGGASDVRQGGSGLSNRIVVAGGGGGDGFNESGGPGGVEIDFGDPLGIGGTGDSVSSGGGGGYRGGSGGFSVNVCVIPDSFGGCLSVVGVSGPGGGGSSYASPDATNVSMQVGGANQVGMSVTHGNGLVMISWRLF
jgi:cysteine-rich repeat protein